MLIRNERQGDDDAIHALTVRAFDPMSFSNGSEAQIIRRLRKAGELSLSLVADEGGGIVGHIAFSPVSIDGADGVWMGLGPISVEPSRQRSGIGKALIVEGLAILKARGVAGCALIGNPAIYSTVGFESDGQLTYGDLDSGSVQRVVFLGEPPRGELRFSKMFDEAT